MSEPNASAAERATPLDALASTPLVTSTQALTGVGASELPTRESQALPEFPLSQVRAELIRYAEKNKLAPKELQAKEQQYRQLLRQLGFLPGEPNARGAIITPTYQFQAAWDKNSPGAVGELFKRAVIDLKYVTLALDRVQISTKVDFSSPKDYIAATLRTDVKTRILQQVNFEFRDPHKVIRPLFGSLKYEGFNLIVNVDSLPKPKSPSRSTYPASLAGVPGSRGAQVGVIWRLRAWEDVQIIFETVAAIDYSMIVPPKDLLADAAPKWDFTRVLSFGVNAQVTLPLKMFPVFDTLAKEVGGNHTITLKVFGKVYGTREGWLRLGGFLARGAAAAAAFVAANPVVLVAAGALVTAVLTGRGIYRDLRTRNYLPMLTAYCAGYAEQLSRALEQTPAELNASLAAYAGFPAARVADEIRAVLRKEDLGELVAGSRGPSSHDVLFDQARRAAEELGRAALLGAIHELLARKDGFQTWQDLQNRYQQVWLPAVKARWGSFRKWCVEWLTLQISSRDQDVHDLFVPLTELDRLVTGR